MEKNVLLNCLSVGKSLIEANTAFYVKEEKAKSAKSKTDRYTQGKKLVRHYIGIERAPDGNAVVEFAVQSRSQSQMRHCFIDIIPKQANLFTLAQSTKKLADRVKLLQDADVKCFCSCPDFNWSGMKWKMKHQYDSLSAGHHSDAPKDDNGEDIAPRVRTPHLCAHLIAAFQGMIACAGSIMKDARTATPPTHEEEAPQPTQEEHPVIGKQQSEENSNEIISNAADQNEAEKARQEAMDSFSQGEGVKTEETQAALNALADNLNPEEQPTEDEEVEDPGLGLIGKRDAEENDPVKQSSLFTYDDNADNPIFDVPLDEEEPEEEVDGENVIEEPIELP